MPLYESTFIARPDISSQQVDGLAEQLREVLEGAGGEVEKTEYWGLRNLAYRIKKNRKGHYYFMNIEAPPAAISAMERTMRINEDVIRYLTVRVDELDPNPAPLTRSRDGRRRGGEGRRGEGVRPRGERREVAPPRPDEGAEPAKRSDESAAADEGKARESGDG